MTQNNSHFKIHETNSKQYERRNESFGKVRGKQYFVYRNPANPIHNIGVTHFNVLIDSPYSTRTTSPDQNL
jgi:hypothetical protein